MSNSSNFPIFQAFAPEKRSSVMRLKPLILHEVACLIELDIPTPSDQKTFLVAVLFVPVLARTQTSKAFGKAHELLLLHDQNVKTMKLRKGRPQLCETVTMRSRTISWIHHCSEGAHAPLFSSPTSRSLVRFPVNQEATFFIDHKRASTNMGCALSIYWIKLCCRLKHQQMSPVIVWTK